MKIVTIVDHLNLLNSYNSNLTHPVEMQMGTHISACNRCLFGEQQTLGSTSHLCLSTILSVNHADAVVPLAS